MDGLDSLPRETKQHVRTDSGNKSFISSPPQFSWTTAKGKLCDGTNTADGRNGTNWKREGGRSLDLPFLALFTVHARGAVAAAAAAAIAGQEQEAVGRTK